MVSTWGRCETGGCCPSFRNAGSETRGIVERCERQPGSVEEMGSSVSRSSLQNARFGKGCGSLGTDLQESTQLIGINRAGRGSRAASPLRFRSSGARSIASSRRPRREAWSAPRYARWRPPASAPTSPAIPGLKAHKPAQSRRRRRRGSSGGTRTPPPSVINSGAAPAGVAITGVRHAMASAVSWVDAIASGRLPTSRPNADDQYVKMSCDGVAERSAPRPVLFGPAAGIAGQPSLAGINCATLQAGRSGPTARARPRRLRPGSAVCAHRYGRCWVTEGGRRCVSPAIELLPVVRSLPFLGGGPTAAEPVVARFGPGDDAPRLWASLWRTALAPVILDTTVATSLNVNVRDSRNHRAHRRSQPRRP